MRWLSQFNTLLAQELYFCISVFLPPLAPYYFALPASSVWLTSQLTDSAGSENTAE